MGNSLRVRDRSFGGAGEESKFWRALPPYSAVLRQAGSARTLGNRFSVTSASFLTEIRLARAVGGNSPRPACNQGARVGDGGRYEAHRTVVAPEGRQGHTDRQRARDEGDGRGPGGE